MNASEGPVDRTLRTSGPLNEEDEDADADAEDNDDEAGRATCDGPVNPSTTSLRSECCCVEME